MQTDFLEYWVGSHFACFIEYGDMDEITDEELKEFLKFDYDVRNAYESAEFMHYSITEETDEFRQCEATGMMGKCIKVHAVYKLGE